MNTMSKAKKGSAPVEIEMLRTELGQDCSEDGVAQRQQKFVKGEKYTVSQGLASAFLSMGAAKPSSAVASSAEAKAKAKAEAEAAKEAEKKAKEEAKEAEKKAKADAKAKAEAEKNKALKGAPENKGA